MIVSTHAGLSLFLWLIYVHALFCRLDVVGSEWSQKIMLPSVAVASVALSLESVRKRPAL